MSEEKKKWRIAVADPGDDVWLIHSGGARAYFDEIDETHDPVDDWHFFLEGQWVASLYQRENVIENIDDFSYLLRRGKHFHKGILRSEK